MIKRRIIAAALSLSAAGLVSLVGYEGYTDRAVIPIPGDVPTIGFGTTEGVRLGDTTNPPKALARALRDVSKFEGAIQSCVTTPLYQSEYDAYTSLAYNIGGSAFCGSTLVRKLNAGDYAGACDQILRWRYAAGRDCSDPASKCIGLWRRRQSEHAMCRGEQ